MELLSFLTSLDLGTFYDFSHRTVTNLFRAGTTLSLLSSVVNALWLVVFSNVSAHLGHVDMYLLLGRISRRNIICSIYRNFRNNRHIHICCMYSSYDFYSHIGRWIAASNSQSAPNVYCNFKWICRYTTWRFYVALCYLAYKFIDIDSIHDSFYSFFNGCGCLLPVNLIYYIINLFT